MAKEVGKLGDQIIGILSSSCSLLGILSRNSHGSEILLRIGSVIDGVNQAGDILLMFKARF